MLLRELLDEVARGNEPPSRLTADEVYAAGQRRRRTTTLARVGAAAVLCIALVAALVVFAPARAPDNAGPVEVPVVSPDVRAVGGYDPRELYAIVLSCPQCEPELHVTRDRGRTWTNRGTMADVNLPGAPWEIRVGRSGAVGVFGNRSGGGLDRVLSTSTDRGRAFAQVTPGDPVDAATPGAFVTCAYRSSANPCVVQVYDLDADTTAPLATQPSLVVAGVQRAPDGTIWALGRDDGAERPAIARSTDGGRTWTTHVFADAPEFTAGYRLLAGKVAAVDGTVVAELTYAPFAAPSRNSNVAFRLRDGDWQRLDTDALGPGAMAMGASYLTADGTFVLQRAVADDAGSSRPVDPAPSGGPVAQEPRIGAQFWSCPPGGTAYGRIDPPTGLSGDQLNAVERLPGGGYLAHDFSSAWVSDDGRSWTRITIR
jgi:hypothetical protein